MNKTRRIEILEEKIQNLNLTMGRFQLQIIELRDELEALKKDENVFFQSLENSQTESVIENTQIIDNQLVNEFSNTNQENPVFNLHPKTESSQSTDYEPITENRPTFNLEDYVGGNLISKLGILILIIGIGIFVNYAIEHNLISPLSRVVLAYLAAGVLLGLSYWLRAGYKSYSAVLFSGGGATFYFTTYLGHSIFNLMPQSLAFGLMVLCTIYIVYEAIRYNEEIIGIIGLVGAYAVPILLSNGGGAVEVMFGYMTLINLGVLLLAFKKDWQRMNLLAFVATWLIFGQWHISKFWIITDYRLGFFYTTWGFNFTFFAIFYLALIAHQIKNQQKFSELRILLLLLNSLFFYWIGISANLFENGNLALYLTLFTLFNVLIHSSLSVYLFLRIEADRQIKYFTSGLTILFLTLAVPIYFEAQLITLFWVIESILLFGFSRRQKIFFFEQASWLLTIISTLSILYSFDNEWVSYLWLSETLILFVVARTQLSPFFERLSYVLAIATMLSVPYFFHSHWIVLFWLVEALILFAIGRTKKSEYFANIGLGVQLITIIGLLYLWQQNYWLILSKFETPIIWNFTFLTSILVIVGLSIFLLIHLRFPFIKDRQNTDNQSITEYIKLENLLGLGIILLVYGLGFSEILHYFNFEFQIVRNQIFQELIYFRNICLIIYSAGFLSILISMTRWIPTSHFYDQLSGIGSLLFTLAIIGIALPSLYQLRQIYLIGEKLYPQSDWYVFIRFGLYLSTLIPIFLYFRLGKLHTSLDKNIRQGISVWLNIFALIMLSFELTNFLVMSSLRNYKSIIEEIKEAENLAFKLGFTLLWAIYSLGLIGYGIWRKRRFLRLTGITIFGITLVKLFLNDVNYASTLTMIFAFIGVGILLLITAFLYQKYKHIILAEDTE